MFRQNAQSGIVAALKEKSQNHGLAVLKQLVAWNDAGRVTRLVRLVRFVRALKIFMMVRRYFARKVDVDVKDKSMAPSSIGSALADRISILVTDGKIKRQFVSSILQHGKMTDTDFTHCKRVAFMCKTHLSNESAIHSRAKILSWSPKSPPTEILSHRI